MDALRAVDAMVLGIVEGLTEFLPVFADGHRVLVATMLGLVRAPAGRVIEAAVLCGAAAAVLSATWRRLLGLLRPSAADARLPGVLAGVLGPAAAAQWVFDEGLRRQVPDGLLIAAMLLVGALLILWVERPAAARRRPLRGLGELSVRQALGLGLVQCLGLVPGLGRAWASIVGGCLFGLSREDAIELSLLVAAPMLGAASLRAVWDGRVSLLHGGVTTAGVFAVGAGFAFVAGRAMIHWLRRGPVVARIGLVPFASYRIALGLVVVATAITNLVRWTA